MKDIIIFGIQGSGKGTQAQIIAEKKRMQIFETGAELRKIKKEDSELGKTVREIIDRGDLVPNEIVKDIVSHFIDGISAEEPVLFDGIPRSIPQKKTLDALLEKKGRTPVGLFLDVPKDEVVKRMKERGREDDTDEVIERRIGNYETETLPVILEYESEGNLIRVNGFQEIDEVTREIF
jgi:adenylate kinase